MKKWILLIIAFVLAGCCDTIINNNGPLPESALLFVPYQAGETYQFKHSNGLIISFESSRETRDEWELLRPCTELRYQINSTRMDPDYPIFSFSLTISNFNAPHIETNVSIGSSGFYIPDNITQAGFFDKGDSLIVGSTTFYNVFTLSNNNAPYFDSGGIYPDTLYYNYDFGILKIIMSNNESYECVL